MLLWLPQISQPSRNKKDWPFPALNIFVHLFLVKCFSAIHPISSHVAHSFPTRLHLYFFTIKLVMSVFNHFLSGPHLHLIFYFKHSAILFEVPHHPLHRLALQFSIPRTRYTPPFVILYHFSSFSSLSFSLFLFLLRCTFILSLLPLYLLILRHSSHIFIGDRNLYHLLLIQYHMSHTTFDSWIDWT